MKLLQVEIEGFGDLRDRRFGPLAPQLNVVFGPNESGKTTLLNFIRTMLLGFPRTWKTFYKPNDGARHGGSVLFKDEEGHLFTLHRHAGANGGTLRLTEGSHDVKDPALRVSKMMGELSSSTYNSVFAFGLEELQRLSLLDNEEIKARMYNVGLGVRNLPIALERIETRRDEIFTERGKTKRMFQIQQRLEEIETGLTRCAPLAKEYGVQLEARRRSETELNATRAALEERRQALAETAVLAQACPIWAELQTVQQSISVVPERADLPSDAIERVDQMESRRLSLGEVLRATEEQITRLSAGNITDRHLGIVRDANAFENIRHRKSAFDTASQQLVSMAQEQAHLLQRSEASIVALGSKWSAERINNVSVNPTVRQQAHEFRSQFDSLRLIGDHKQRDLTAAAEMEIESNVTLGALNTRMASLVEPTETAGDIDAKRSHLRTAKRLYDGLKRLRDKRELLELQSQVTDIRQPVHSTMPAALIGVIIATVTALGAASFMSHGLVRGLFLFASVAALAAGWIFGQKRRVVMPEPTAIVAAREQLDALRREEVRTLQALNDAASPLGITVADDDSLARAEDQLEAELNNLRQWEDLSDKTAQATAKHERNLAAATLAGAAMEQARVMWGVKEREWDTWILTMGLDAELTPEGCPSFLDRLEAAQQASAKLSAVKRSMISLQEEIRDFSREVNGLGRKHEIAMPSDIGAAADTLLQHYADANRANVASETIAVQLESLSKDRDRVATSLEEEEARLQELLRSVSAQDSADLRRAVQDEVQLRALRIRETELQRQLDELSEATSGEDVFRARLQATTRDGLIRQRERLNSEIGSLSNRKDESTTEIARLATQMKQLEGQDRTAELLSEEELLLEELEGLAREWSVLALASALLRRTKGRYETERKPAVIQHAEKFIGMVTGGRYPHISAPADTNEIHVATQSGVVRSPEQLSRGTLEQLYLALRFGLVRQFSELAIPLPVIVDEIFVDFDPERAARVADAFVELSATNQIIVLTCHPWVVDLLKTASHGTANVITLAA
jgi:uncharacterized protein YhaN